MLLKGIITSVCIGMVMWVNAQHTRFHSLNIEDGILSDHIDHVFVDSYGYVWISTYDGLQRWDGQQGITYTFDPDNSNSLSSNICYTVAEGKDHTIWIGTINGLCKYDRYSKLISRIPVGGKDLPVNALHVLPTGELWIGTSRGIYRMSKDGKIITPIDGVKDLTICDIDADVFGNIWVATFEKGVIKVFDNGKQLKLYSSPFVASNKVRSLLCDKQGNVWVGTYDNGISIIHSNKGTVRHLSRFGSKQHPKGGFDEIRSIYQDKNNTVWVGLLDEPLYKYDSVQHDLIPQEMPSENHPEKKAEGIFSIAEDNFGNTWFATHGFGLFYTNAHKNKIAHYHGKKYGSAKNTIVTCVLEDKNGILWSGTDGGGLTKRFPNGQTTTYTVQQGLSSNAIHHLDMDANDILWISTWGGGIMKMDTRSGKITAFTRNKKDKFSINNDNSKCILVTDSLVWVGTHGDGLAILDKQSGNIYHAGNNDRFPFDMKEPAWINHIFKDKKNRIWVSTCYGLYKIYNNKMTSYHKADKRKSISDDYINMVAEDTFGVVWIVGESGGLQRYDEKADLFVKIRHPAIPETIKSIVADIEGNIWLGTNIGLLFYEVSKNELYRYTNEDGLQSDRFFHKAICLSISGDVLVGGINGLNRCNSNLFKIPLPQRILDFESALLQGDQPDTTMMLGNGMLTIPSSYKVTTIHFCIPDQYFSSKLLVQYRLEGFNRSWIPLSQGSRNITLTGITPSHYTLVIRCSEDGIHWVEFKNKLIIEVLPAWWQTIWFKSIVFILVLIGLLVFYYARTAFIRKRNQLLHHLVNERTAELHEKNAELLERNDDIASQNEKLEQLNVEFKRQTHTILQHQNSILARNRDLTHIVGVLGKSEDLTDISTADDFHDLDGISARVALFHFKINTSVEQVLATYVEIAYCNSEEELEEYFPDFILIDELFDKNIPASLSHIPIIRIVGGEGLLSSPQLIVDITVSEHDVPLQLILQIKQYIARRKQITDRFASEELLVNDEIATNSLDKEFLEMAISVIELHLSDPALDSELLCKELNLSRTVLYSKIKLLTGLGVHEYIRMIRIKKSVDLLKQRRLNVSQIAYEVGFSSPSYYIRCFVKQFGMPPKEYVNKS